MTVKIVERLEAALDRPKVYTMRELNQHTARVLEEINESGRPAAITKHGQFVALITPLRNAQIESMVLSEGPLAHELEQRAIDVGDSTYDTDEMADQLADRYRNRDADS